MESKPRHCSMESNLMDIATLSRGLDVRLLLGVARDRLVDVHREQKGAEHIKILDALSEASVCEDRVSFPPPRPIPMDDMDFSLVAWYVDRPAGCHIGILGEDPPQENP